MYIESIHLENIKSFERLELEFLRRSQQGDARYAGMNFFVGGNSSGKSTLLKCLAMAVSGPTIAAQHIVQTAGWIRRSATKGTIEVHLHWDSEDDQLRGTGAPPSTAGFKVGLIFEAEKSNLTPVLKGKDYRQPNGTRVRSADRGPWNVDAKGWFLGAYGPLRRLTGSSTDALRYSLARGNLGSCVTLFREDAALSESETWLKQEYSRSLQQKDQNQPVSPLVENVKTLLNEGLLPDGFKITRVTVDDVFMSTPNGVELPLRDLSDGCRSTYALVLDIIHSMAAAYGDKNLFRRDRQGPLFVDRPGVILIDELEAHLHPSWQRTICEWLKTRFPRVQFFNTTHSPIILQSADEGGVFVLPLPDELTAGRVVRRLGSHEHDRIVLGRAEKVLLGEAFGLKRTWSLQAEKLVKQWEKLAALKHANGRLPSREQKELARLEKKVQLVFDDMEPEMLDA
jgi:energy-coupling factor transporter ATP-binding protein EcfA2